ncbi:beta-glucosidase [Reticulibacter mediterranei]|uniref:Beta-glucosidase n=1 Tax=Reticulibacter mediterranei TaxID=2778369 RepID=A0A8J3IQL2_9CHLR|nr:beta-N-acetylhexosaminidase [Reticulibacter mediterranei]GHO95070.1 beta-glucosidase [Reticulibacter mediterranei]
MPLNMSLEEQIGQVLVAGFPGPTPSPEIIDLIQRHHVGNIILFSRNIQNAQQLRRLTSELQRIAREAGHRHPLLIGIDQENGSVRRLGSDATIFPGNMALGAIGSEQMAYKIASAGGHELLELGVNLNFAPVVDVNNNPANPVIGNRSFGEDPQQVARLGSSAVKGWQDAGVIACLKHFPGHGDTAVDSHLALPILPYALQRLEEVELVPFQSGIAAGAAMIMSAHISFPAITHDEALPATLSPAILRGLLRDQLGFKGVIISDCLEMKAISEGVGIARGSVLALLAGIDLVLISHLYERQRAGINAIKAALDSGELPHELLQQAVERVIQLKQRYLSWEDQTPPQAHLQWVGNVAHQQLSEQAYALSTTLVRNQQGLIPLQLQSKQRLAIVYPVKQAWTEVADRKLAIDDLVQQVQQRHANVSVHPFKVQSDDLQDLLNQVREADIVLAITVNANLDPQQTALMQALVQSGQPVIGLAVHNPYDLIAFPQLGTYLASYEYTPPALTAAVHVIFGEREAQGHLPVSLPGIS